MSLILHLSSSIQHILETSPQKQGKTPVSQPFSGHPPPQKKRNSEQKKSVGFFRPLLTSRVFFLFRRRNTKPNTEVKGSAEDLHQKEETFAPWRNMLGNKKTNVKPNNKEKRTEESKLTKWKQRNFFQIHLKG